MVAHASTPEVEAEDQEFQVGSEDSSVEDLSLVPMSVAHNGL